ncbi:unnamed protein product [Acanthoscelides obtectus]|uniref:Uncharacterized protein n=1 Tax=Acanthoscelides obtectus TaxID=200917 RepID=A0A9P0LKB9_ACAOB|nr:unnamed protein product [Acanthoscelides obtectus]CAK1680299.1 hypothetical protein AOBTE_LOCUS32567 [Acanthoscelides obtectus]
MEILKTGGGPSQTTDGNQENSSRSMEQLADISRGWKEGADLKKPVSAQLKRSISKPAQSDKAESQESKRANTCKPSNRRRPTETVIRSLSSNQLAEKYNLLVDKKNVIADHVQKKLEQEIDYARIEHELRVQALKYDIKKRQLDSLRP